MDDLTLPGCYGMTELGHGSNVMGIETTAEYDPSTQVFVINTPNDDASKYWIGGAAQHGKVCALLAVAAPVHAGYIPVHVAGVLRFCGTTDFLDVKDSVGIASVYLPILECAACNVFKDVMSKNYNLSPVLACPLSCRLITAHNKSRK
jgi:hypothetical protein